MFLNAKMTVFSDVTSLNLRHLNVEVASCTDILADIFVKEKTRCYAQKILFISALGTSNFIKLSDSME